MEVFDKKLNIKKPIVSPEKKEAKLLQ